MALAEAGVAEVVAPMAAVVDAEETDRGDPAGSWAAG